MVLKMMDQQMRFQLKMMLEDPQRWQELEVQWMRKVEKEELESEEVKGQEPLGAQWETLQKLQLLLALLSDSTGPDGPDSSITGPDSSITSPGGPDSSTAFGPDGLATSSEGPDGWISASLLGPDGPELPSGGVDTRSIFQKTFWVNWDSVLTLAQGVSTLETFPEHHLGSFGTVCQHYLK
ncbi:hypothetical protein Taro_032681 [Colocasia esculenta]|uniref:Uncharacterized protein n=1 Tax=Colocasia esculenta TaxID=4460 RepID=A0A843WA57_COLES|nr:hypothetical protein [Colocasia esculenta]